MNDDRRRDRKRRKREQHRRQRQNREQKTQERRMHEQRPNKSDPAVAVCLHDLAVPVSQELVLAVWEALRDGKAVATEPAPEMGDDRTCWHDVRRLVEKHGGELVMGWSVCDVPPRTEIPPQRNRFARTALNPHAVWLHGGRYYETCPERVRMGTRFLPTGKASVVCDAGIEFFDSAEAAGAVDWPVMSFDLRPFAALVVGLRSPAPGNPAAARETAGLAAGTTGEVFNAAGKVGVVIPAQGIEGAIRFEIDAIHPAGVPAGNPGWVQVLIAGSEYCRINPDLCRPPYHRLGDCVLIAHRHRERLPLGGRSATLLALPPAPHPEAQEVLFWRERLTDGEVVMVDTPGRVRRMGGRV